MLMKKIIAGAVVWFTSAPFCLAQLHWVNVDSLFSPLSASVHVYKTTDNIDGKSNIAFYVVADLKDMQLNFTTDTTFKRRFTPQQFFEKNQEPLVVVNGTFFDFASNRNLNVVVKDGKMVSYNIHSIALKGKDSLLYLHTFRSAIGINKKRQADVAWLFTDSSKKHAYGSQLSIVRSTDYVQSITSRMSGFPKWKMQTAIGGGPVLIQKGSVSITNYDEAMFTGKAIDDKHPRTAMGYTKDNKLIILVVQGRFPGIAEGASLNHLAKILLDIGCVEALNLDGGGSSCLLINGKQTIKPSDKEGQRPVPAVFIIQQNKK
jgi:exopolysaccharide biosynthesis protein